MRMRVSAAMVCLVLLAALATAATTETLTVTDGYDQKEGKTLSTMGKTGVVQDSDDTRWQTQASYYTSFTFSLPAVPEGSIIQSVVLYVEHHEDPGFGSGSLIWKVGTGWSGSTAETWGTHAAPVRFKDSSEGVDAWDVTTAVDTLDKLNAMELCVQNNDKRKSTWTDHVYAEVTYESDNAAPVATDDAATTDEDTAVTIDVLANDTDADGDTLSLDSVGPPAYGTALGNADDTITYTPDPDYNGSDAFTYTISDGNGGSDTGTVSVTIYAVNDPPVAADDAAETYEDQSVTIDVLANDSDIDGDTLSVASVTDPSNGSATLNPDGTITYLPALDFYGTDGFDYTLSDGGGGTDTATVTVTVTKTVDITGVDIIEPASTTEVPQYEKIELQVYLADTAYTNPYEPDPALGGIDVEAVFTGPGGTWQIPAFFDGTSWLIRFAPDTVGSWECNVTATDPSGPSNTWTLSFSCVVSAHPGWARIDGHWLRFTSGEVLPAVGHNNGWLHEVREPSPASMAASGENLLSFWLATPWETHTSLPTRAPIENSEQGIGNYNQDACAYIDTVVADAEVAGVYLLPTIWSHDQLCQDLDWGEPSWFNNAYNTLCTEEDFYLTGSTEQWRYQQNLYRYLIARWGYSRALVGWVGLCEAEGTDGYRYDESRVYNWCTAVRNFFADNDPFRTSDAGQYPITFTKTDWYDWNYWGSAVFDLRSADSYVSKTDDVAIADTIASEALDMWATGQPGFHAEWGGDITAGASQPTHLHNGIWAGITAGAAMSPVLWCDEGGFVKITDNPDYLYYSESQEMRSHLAILSDFLAARDYYGDPNLAPDTVSIASPCRGWTLKKADRGFAWIQNTNGTMGGQTVTISGLLDGSYTVNWYDVWDSGTSVIHSASALVGTDGNLTATVPTLSQADIACTFAREPNTVPVAADDSYSTDEDAELAIAAPGVLANDTDDDGPSDLTASLVDPPTDGSLVLNADGSFTYTPDPDFNGSDAFTYRAYDGLDFSNVATVDITVSSVNDAPTASDDAYATDQDTPLSVPTPGVLGNDSDVEGDPLAAALATAPASGTVTLNTDGSFTYTPNTGFYGTDSFTYTASDGLLDSNAATVTITVNRLNTAPVANDDSATTDEDTAVTIDVLANDTDADGDTLTVTNLTQPANGTATLNADDTVTYAPAANWSGTDTFTYTANDGIEDSNEATVTITVNSVNDLPVADAGPDQTITDSDGNGSETVTLDGSASSDPDGTILTYQWAEGTEELGMGTTLDWPFGVGTHTVTLTVTDDEGGVDSDTVTITVNEEQENIFGFVTLKDGGSAMSGITITLLRKSRGWQTHATTTTDDHGRYAFDGLAAGDYKVMPESADWSFEPPQEEVTLTTQDDSVQVDFLAK